MYFSPKTSADGLVFHYDTGNTVRSYLGEPTVNLVNPNWSAWSVDGSGQGTIGTRTLLSTYHCRIVDVVANTRQYIFVEGVSASTQYTFSVKFLKITGAPTLRFQLQAYNGGNYISAWFPTTVQIGVADIDGWQTAYYTVTTPANTTRVLWFMQDGDDYTTYTHSFELKEPQAEAKSHPTQFTTGTRSATQGLKDLTAANTINLSNVSFDSNAQMTFDGTDDLIDVTTNLGTLSAYTFEYVSYSNSAGNMPLSSRTSTAFYKYGAYSWRYTHGGVGGEFYHSYGSDTGWAHWVITYDGATIKVYENNISKGTSASSGTADFTGGIRIGSWTSSASYTWDGTIPIMKMYNRALTSNEIQQNFNAYKKRFNL